MATTATMSTNFAHETVSDLFNKVRGKSSLAKMAGQTPIAFTGTDIFTFNFDHEISVVAEAGQKQVGGITLAPVSITPVKVEYGARVTDEFLRATEEKQLEILSAFNEGFAAKLAKGFDIMAMHGYNPNTGTASTVIGTNHLDSVTNTVTYAAANVDANVEGAIAMLGDYDASGIIFSKTAAQAMAAMTASGMPLYPEFKFGGVPASLGGATVDVNSTVNANSNLDRIIVGDFNAFKWGYAAQIPLTVIPYGDPDGQGDLARLNEVYLRAEAYIGWGILDKDAFARVVASA